MQMIFQKALQNSMLYIDYLNLIDQKINEKQFNRVPTKQIFT